MKNKKNIKITIVDIANRVGVSPSTVSRVINNYPFIKEETRQKILRVVEEMNYYPDLIARSMKKGRTFNIGLVIGGLNNPFFAETAEVVLKRAEFFNCNVTLCVNEENVQKMNECIDSLIAKRVDGVVIGSVLPGDESTVRLKNHGIPYVLFNRRREDSDYVIQDNTRGAYQAVSHLIKLGHSRIALLHGPFNLDTVEGRVKGYFKAFQEYKIKMIDSLIKEIRYNVAESEVYIAMTEIMNGPKKPTAIFCTADFLALDAMDYLYQNGYKVPEDVAVFGFDNTKISGHSLLALSTVGQKATEMAELAVDHLMRKIENQITEDGNYKILLIPDLIIRRTCGSHLPVHKLNY